MFPFLHFLVPLFWLTVATALNMLLMLYDKYFDLPVDLELSHLSSILMSFTFGLGWGLATAVITKLAVMLNNMDFSFLSPISIGCYMLAAVLAHLLGPFFPNITIMVITIVLISNLTSYLIMSNLLNMKLHSYTYSISNIAFNILLVSILRI